MSGKAGCQVYRLGVEDDSEPDFSNGREVEVLVCCVMCLKNFTAE